MKVATATGSFAGNKDAAAHIRETYLVPKLRAGRTAILDFSGVDLATQSFVHALIASVVRERPDDLQKIEFRGCNDSIRALIEIVVEYAQDEFE